MVRHIVSWNFKPELDEAQRSKVREEVVARINALKELIPCVLEVRAYCPPWTAATATWSSTLRWPLPRTCLSTRTILTTRPSSP